jgi:hypothetical protein
MSDDDRSDELSIQLADDEAELIYAEDDEYSLTDLVNRLLDKGVVISGEVTIAVAGVDLVHLNLQVILASVSTLRALQGRRNELADPSA